MFIKAPFRSYPEPHKSKHRLFIFTFKRNFSITIKSTLTSSKGVLFNSSDKNIALAFYFSPAYYGSGLLITLVIRDEEYKLIYLALFSFLLFSLRYYFLDPNILHRKNPHWYIFSQRYCFELK